MDKKILIGVVAAFLIIGGVVAFKALQPDEQPVEQLAEEYVPAEQPVEQPTIDEANIILTENIRKTLALDSSTSEGDVAFKIKDGEAILFRVAMEDTQISKINPFNFAKQDSRGIITYSILMNFEAIVDFIERVKTQEELEELRAVEGMIGMDVLAVMRALGEANISVIMEMKSIDSDTYMKITEIRGLRELISGVMGHFVAKALMAEIEPHLEVWRKTPADPLIKEKRTAMFEDIEGLMPTVFDAYYVKEVLPNTKVNEVPVYNFALGLDLDKMKNVVISFASLFAEEEVPVEEKEEMIAEINKNWPEIVKVIEAMEIDSRTYICQKTRFTMKGAGSVNMNLHEFMVMAKSIMQEAEPPVTPEEKAEFARTKEAIKNMSIVATMNFVHSEHNAVTPILPPAEYEVIDPEPMPVIIEPEPMPVW